MRTTMFKGLSMLVAMLVAGFGSTVAQTLSIDDFYIEMGATKQVTIDLVKGQHQVKGFQCDPLLPKGLTIQRVKAVSGILPEDEWGDEIEPSVIYRNGRILFYNDMGVTIKETAKELVTLYVKADDNFRGGKLSLINIVISGENNEKIEPATVTAVVTSNFVPTEYAISYELNGGTYADGVANPETYTDDDADFTLINPIREGYTFIGWTGTGLEEPTKEVSISRGTTGDLSYTANWTPNKYVIRYYVGDEVWKEEEVECGAPVVLTDEFPLDDPEHFTLTWIGEAYETMPAHDIEYSAEITGEIPAMEEATVDFSDAIDETTDLEGTVIGNLFVNISEDNGGYDAEDNCIVLTATTSEETVDALDGLHFADPTVMEDYTGIIFKVPAGIGVVKVTAATMGNKVLDVKVGDAEAIECQTDSKQQLDFYYNVPEETYIYVYAGDGSASVKGMRRVGEEVQGEVRIYSIGYASVDVGVQGLADSRVTSDNVAYTLGGQKVSSDALRRGTYIVNGKKVVIR